MMLVSVRVMARGRFLAAGIPHDDLGTNTVAPSTAFHRESGGASFGISWLPWFLWLPRLDPKVLDYRLR